MICSALEKSNGEFRFTKPMAVCTAVYGNGNIRGEKIMTKNYNKAMK